MLQNLLKTKNIRKLRSVIFTLLLIFAINSAISYASGSNTRSSSALMIPRDTPKPKASSALMIPRDTPKPKASSALMIPRDTPKP
jgi:hypothetical protein